MRGSKAVHLHRTAHDLRLEPIGHLALLLVCDPGFESHRVLPHNLEADRRVARDDPHVVMEVAEDALTLRRARQPLSLLLRLLETRAVDDDCGASALNLHAPLPRCPLRQHHRRLHTECGRGHRHGVALPTD
eukprot:scaffold3513_cov127-Isochrysis_galbana.AAC.3